MRQRTSVLAVVALAALAVVACAATATATGLDEARGDVPDPVAAATDGASNDSMSPGQRLTGVIGAQRAEVEGEIETRSFGVRVAAAGSSRAKAGVVAAEVNDLESRLETLQNRKAGLERAHENGNVSDGLYRARLTELVVRIETTQRRINATDDVANDVPESDLEAAGVEQSNIAQLRQRATNLSDRESTGLARSVVGEGVGRGMGDPASSVLDTVASGNFSSGAFVEGNENETDAPGRGNGRNRGDGRTPGVATGANATASVGNGSANAGGANASAGANATVGGDGANATVGVGVDGNGVTVSAGASRETGTDETATDAPTATPTDETDASTTTDDSLFGGVLSDDTTTTDTSETAAETETAA